MNVKREGESDHIHPHPNPLPSREREILGGFEHLRFGFVSDFDIRISDFQG